MKFIRSISNEGPDADLDWVDRSIGKLLCKHCRTVNRALYPEPIEAVLRTEPRRTWTAGGPFRVGVSIYRAEFADIIQRAVPQFVAGRCRLPDGTVLASYVTLYSDKWVLMRGDERTRTNVCATCGSIWSDLVMVFPGRPAYLLRHQLTGDMVYEGCWGGLFMADELVETIPWGQFPDLRIQSVDVRDTPLDGRRLPGDPDWEALRQ